MSFATFSACGTVRDIQTKTTGNGQQFVELTMHVGTWQGDDGQQHDDVLVLSLWRDTMKRVHGVNRGDIIGVSGTLRSTQSQAGYWNIRASVRDVVVASRAQRPAPQQGFQQPTPPRVDAYYDNSDIPFDNRPR